eukprot:2731910-Pleurochrysis_carterae.AAC.1
MPTEALAAPRHCGCSSSDYVCWPRRKCPQPLVQTHAQDDERNNHLVYGCTIWDEKDNLDFFMHLVMLFVVCALL